MNEKDKGMRQKNEKQRELTELLNLLNTVDQQITPEHVARRFQELLETTGDGSAIPADPAPALADSPDSSETQAEQESAQCRAHEFHDGNIDLVDIASSPDQWNLSVDIINTAHARYDAIIAITQLKAEKIYAEAWQAKRCAAEEYEKARQVLAEAQQNDDAALDRAATMIADARRQAADILATAKRDADRVLADVRRQAADILATAKRDADRVLADARHQAADILATVHKPEYTRFDESIYEHNVSSILFVSAPTAWGKSALLARLAAQPGHWPQVARPPDDYETSSFIVPGFPENMRTQKQPADATARAREILREERCVVHLIDLCAALPDSIATCVQHSSTEAQDREALRRARQEAAAQAVQDWRKALAAQWEEYVDLDPVTVRRPADVAGEILGAQFHRLRAAVTTPFSRNYFTEAYARILNATVTAADPDHINGPPPAQHEDIEHRIGVVARRDVGSATAQEMTACTARRPADRPSPAEASPGAPVAGARAIREFGELESAIMDVLWAGDRAYLAREVRERLSYPRPVAYTTVMIVMNILYGKGVLCREKHGQAWRYWPVESREEHDARLMAEVLRSGGDQHIVMLGSVERTGDETPTPQPELSGTNTLQAR